MPAAGIKLLARVNMQWLCHRDKAVLHYQLKQVKNMPVRVAIVEPIAGLFVDISRPWETPFDKLMANGG
jgi:hypothetical protein